MGVVVGSHRTEVASDLQLMRPVGVVQAAEVATMLRPVREDSGLPSLPGMGAAVVAVLGAVGAGAPATQPASPRQMSAPPNASSRRTFTFPSLNPVGMVGGVTIPRSANGLQGDG